MTKHEAAWLSIRVTGLAIALSGMKQFSLFFYVAWMLLSGELRDFTTNVAARTAFNSTWPASLGGAIIFGVGAYLLFGSASWLHAILMKERKEK